MDTDDQWPQASQAARLCHQEVMGEFLCSSLSDSGRNQGLGRGMASPSPSACQHEVGTINRSPLTLYN